MDAATDTKIKIVSNPYARSLSFMRWEGEWQPIDYSTAPTSGLMSEDILNGFLPFKAKEIVDLLVDEYGEATSIIFEGPKDEYEDLATICAEECYGGKVKLLYGERDLANADDILPSIVEVFRKVDPLITANIADKKAVASDIDKFIDVSKDQVPLCVIGNYSAGKSTFINALIGYEILPSGTEAVTAKVFKISEGNDPDYATISFGEGREHQELVLDSRGLCYAKSSCDLAFSVRLSSYLDGYAGQEGLAGQVHRTLQFLNEYAPDEEQCQVEIPDLIELSVPFNPVDPWAESANFVIFDTPGSNSETNEDHARVLREAMEGLSNGLLIFLAMPKTLDTIDNANLCNAAKSIDAMDDRFTMVIVNSADQIQCPLEGFSSRHEQNVRDQTVPRELSPQGIYYVSSPVALGAKTGGSFVDDGTKWVFDGVRRRFSDAREEQYTELYRCNILPPHIKQRSNSDSESSGNLLLANSGLYVIEREIVLFAQRYSAYNKCQQAEMLLRRLIEATSEVLDSQMLRYKVDLGAKENALKKDKAQLIEEIGTCRRDEERHSIAGYSDEVRSQLSYDQWTITLATLQSRESSYTQDSSQKHGLEEALDSAKEEQRSARESLAALFASAVESKDASSLRTAFQGAMDEVERISESKSKINAKQRDVDRTAATMLLDYVRSSFTHAAEGMSSDIQVRSKRYWAEAAEKTRQALYDCATESTALSEDKRREIANIIICFRELSFPADADAVFVRSELEESLRLLNIVIFESERLNLRKIMRVYNSRLRQLFESDVQAIADSHEKSYLAWLDNLMYVINNNIESYNPRLQEQVASIRIREEQIKDLEEKLSILSNCLETVTQLISWRERG